MKRQRALRSKSGRRLVPKRRIRAVTKCFCCWCNEEIPEGEAWAGDIAGALAYRQLISASRSANQTALCLSCGTDRLPRLLQAANEGNPELRLRFPVPEMFRFLLIQLPTYGRMELSSTSAGRLPAGLNWLIYFLSLRMITQSNGRIAVGRMTLSRT